MARSRIELHEKLVRFLGSNQVYFKAPVNIQMKYPAIVYSRSNFRNTFADNVIYRQLKQYTITIIHRDPDSDLPDRMLQEFRYCRFDRHYVADNLDHDVFTLFY